jgi:excisionase family DNA binding protein
LILSISASVRQAHEPAGSSPGLERRKNVTKPAYSLAEARALAGVGRTTLYKVIRAGELRAIKIGGRTVILADDLLRWLNRMPAIVPTRTAPPESAADASVIVRDKLEA